MSETVHLAVYNTLSDWEYGYAVAGINGELFQREPGRFTVVTVGESRDPVTTAGGLKIVPDMTLDELSPEDSAMLILPGASLWDEGGNVAFAKAARRFLAAGVPVAAICGGTFGLAREGLLDDRPHTSAAVEYLSLAADYRGQDEYRDEPAVTDGNLITAGPANPVEFAKHIFARLSVYSPETLDGWYSYYTTGDSSHMFKLLADHGVS